MKRSVRKGLGFGLLVAVLFVLVAGAVYVFISTVLVSHAPQPPVAVKTQPKPVELSSNVLALGNTFWGRYINDWSMASPLKQAYPFSRLSEFHRDQYDAWLTGLECPTVPDVAMTSAEMEATLTFNCDPSYLSEAAKWFTAFTLANNHTDNQGADGFAVTKQQLDKHGIQYFGHYDPRALDDLCNVISLPVTVVLDDGTKSKGELPVAMCGYHGVFRIPAQEAIDKIVEYAEYMPVLSFPHMGAEYKAEPDEIKTTTYRSMIDAGADVVLGDHPHWIQTTESYKGHLIVYSMGNFMFDQQDTQEVVRSAGIRIVMEVKNARSEQLAAWLGLGKTCKTYQDSCLAQAKAQGLEKLDISYQFGVVGTNDSGKIVKPATEAQQAGILERLRWQQTMSQLHPPYSSL
jgi:poly-gamma-glutamate synthesis protein (capsule biosynthesis protein)